MSSLAKRKHTSLSTEVHQGNLLRDLKDWYGKSIAAFCKKIDMSSKWYHDAIKEERIPKLHQNNISRSLNIPIEYWTGGAQLPLNPVESNTDNTSLQPNRELQLISELNEVKSKYINSLERELTLTEKIQELQQEIERLAKQSKTH